ncbi:hypothetical protein P9112_009352 [Eukaryota sp. TZLM1-RC]
MTIFTPHLVPPLVSPFPFSPLRYTERMQYTNQFTRNSNPFLLRTSTEDNRRIPQCEDSSQFILVSTLCPQPFGFVPYLYYWESNPGPAFGFTVG